MNSTIITKSVLTTIRTTVAALVLGAAVFGSFASSARADAPAADINAPYFVNAPFPGFTFGWSFTPTVNMNVTALGWFDLDCDGLTSSHAVGLWTNMGTLLGNVTVPSGMSADLALDMFWYEYLGGPISLNAGQTYVIGGTSGTDEFLTNVAGVNFTPDVNFGTARLRFTGGPLQYPNFTNGFANPGYFGANFLYNLGGPGGGGGAVPEPGAMATLAGAGFAGLIVLRKRRK